MTTVAETDAAPRALLLGRAWLERGQTTAAEAHLNMALALAPGHPDAHRWLGYLRLHQERPAEAAAHLAIAAATAIPSSPLHRELAEVQALAGAPPPSAAFPDQPGGRLRLAGTWERTHHRSGWRYAVQALHGLHHCDGVLCETFLEDPFAWQHPRSGRRSGAELLAAVRRPTYAGRLTSEERHLIPYREPWVGFLHNPPNMPSWLHGDEAPATILAKPVFQESLHHCVGLFTLSEYAARWLRTATGKPVSALLHPTETPTLVFDFERFRANPQKQVVQVGWWLRRLAAIDHLPLPVDNALGYRKLRLLPSFFPGAPDYLRGLLAAEYDRDGYPDPAIAANTREWEHIPNDAFDQLLAENIAFVSLYDASANNAVIECLVRATPLLVNRLPAVEEYLGSDYPLYFDDLADAAAKALDLERLRAAHDYLLAWPLRRRLDASSFRAAVVASEVYQRL